MAVRSTLMDAAIQHENAQEYAVSNCDYDAFFVCTEIVDNFVKNGTAMRLTVGVQRLFVKMPKHCAVVNLIGIKHLAVQGATGDDAYPPFARHTIFVHKSSQAAVILQRRRPFPWRGQLHEG